jgi:methionine synthase II (cobalamin-independent)
LVHFHKRQKFVAGEQSLKGELSQTEYDNLLRKETEETIRQEESGIDVLVHGEFERNDMVEYFENNWTVSLLQKMAGYKVTAVVVKPRLFMVYHAQKQ